MHFIFIYKLNSYLRLRSTIAFQQFFKILTNFKSPVPCGSSVFVYSFFFPNALTVFHVCDISVFWGVFSTQTIFPDTYMKSALTHTHLFLAFLYPFFSHWLQCIFKPQWNIGFRKRQMFLLGHSAENHQTSFLIALLIALTNLHKTHIHFSSDIFSQKFISSLFLQTKSFSFFIELGMFCHIKCDHFFHIRDSSWDSMDRRMYGWMDGCPQVPQACSQKSAQNIPQAMWPVSHACESVTNL